MNLSAHKNKNLWLSWRTIRFYCLLLSFAFTWNSALFPQEESTKEWSVSEAEKLFALSIEPILRDKCQGCHGEDPEGLKGGFDARSLETMLLGGDSFGDAVLLPGNADESSIMGMLRREELDFEMPPKEAERLSATELEDFAAWIDGGAPWPDAKRIAEIYERFAEGVTWPTSGGLSEEWTNRKYNAADLWAYRPLKKASATDAPAVDFFIDKKLAELGIQASPQAARRDLIRRATYDLHGLPPQPSDIQKFVDDPRPTKAAFADLVERLLDSPHYGEQWGRHWLDVVRYSDSSGFANDWERPNAWRYRDYVIRAFNEDKPYDQFILEQIAGDELAEKLAAGGNLDAAKRSELLIAAGFLRMGPWEHTAMSVAKVTRQQFLDDVTDSVGQVFLAHPLQCARCHDHKFDPVPTQDYYSIQAVFATTQFAEMNAAWLPNENTNGIEEDRKLHSRRMAANKKRLATVGQERRQAEQEWFASKGLPYKSIQQAKKSELADVKIPEVTEILSPDIFGRERIARKWEKKLPWEADRYEPIAYTVYTGKSTNQGHSKRLLKPQDPKKKGNWESTYILTGGDPFANGTQVQPGVLSAAAVQKTTLTAQPEGRRLEFARWITDPNNPLAARVMANRIWQFHFGKGLAGNPNNFGATGKKPTHPQLLDWLASDLVSSGWSIKHLHRTIMNSAAYQRTARHSAAAKVAAADPNKESYAHFLPRRLAAEEIRDAMLSVSGELNTEIGGIPARPDINLEAALQPRMIMGTFAPSYVPNAEPAQRNRRSIYALRLRGQRDPFLETFNQPGMDKSCELRDNSTVTPQALTLLNGQESIDRSIAFANSVLQSTDVDANVIEQIFLRAYGRKVTDEELETALNHWQQMTKVHTALKPIPRAYPSEVVRTAVDENTGKPFTFTEQLIGYENYIPDLEAHQVDARTRALADLCLAILNSNEFVYIY